MKTFFKKIKYKRKPKFDESKKGAKFIVIEGGEGSGKSTLMIALQEVFGDKIVTTREPGGSPYAELIRTTAIKTPLAKTAPAETTLCLMFGARYDNLVNMIKPALEKGLHVVSDRFDASSYTYQVHSQSGGKLDKLFWELRKRLSIVPDLYVFIDVDPKEGIRRARGRNQLLLDGKQYDHFDDRELGFHEQVRIGYKKFFKKVPHIVIDANRPLDEVKSDFLQKFSKLLG
jgi:dTMP kinase